MKPYYSHGGITIYHGDCLEVMPSLPDQSIDLVLTDPPYGVNHGEWWDDLAGDALAAHTMQWLVACRKIAPAIVSFWGWKRLDLAFALFKPTYGHLHIAPWVKPLGTHYPSGTLDGMFSAWEPILWCSSDLNVDAAVMFSRLLKTTRENCGVSRGAVDMVIRGKKTGLCYRWEEGACVPSEADGQRLAHFLRSPELEIAAMRIRPHVAKPRPNYFECRTQPQGRHPCEKPVSLMREILACFAPDATSVCDPFMGVGGTLVAAQERRIEAIGIEIEERYCEIAAKRLRQEVLLQ